MNINTAVHADIFSDLAESIREMNTVRLGDDRGFEAHLIDGRDAFADEPATIGDRSTRRG